MSISLGSVVWSSVKPIIKIYLIIGTGFMLSRVDILTAEATKSISDIVLTVLLPCLSFNKIVANIEDQDIKNVGIICLSSVLIFGTGLFFAYAVRRLLPVPKRWYGGILAGGMFPNISDLPIAYLQTLDQGFIFTEEEGEKGVANVIIFLTMFLICVFNLGGFRLIEMDFHYNDQESAIAESEKNSFDPPKSSEDAQDEGTSVNDSNNRDPTDRSMSTVRSLNSDETTPSFSTRLSAMHRDSTLDNCSTVSISATQSNDTTSVRAHRIRSQPIAYTPSFLEQRRSTANRPRRASVSIADDVSDLVRIYSNVDQFGKPANQLSGANSSLQEGNGKAKKKRSNLSRIITSDATVTGRDVEESGSSLPTWLQKIPVTKFIVFFIKNCLRPASIAVIIALIIAFIPWVKALFVTTSHTPTLNQAPDQQPALSFLMDFTGYVGAASVPFGLILLGATLGRLKIGKLYPGFWKSAVTLVILRQCVMPIFGILWCDRLVKAGWVNWEDDKLLLFVIAITWGLPTMTTIIYFTASYTPQDMVEPVQMECVSFFLMLQYPLLVVSLPFLVTYFLKVQLKI